MLKSLSIENFRCFEKFDLAPLGRINLLVGQNNSGKTSILEAIHILCAGENLENFADILLKRGECWHHPETVLHPQNLFYGYEIDDSNEIRLYGEQSENLSLEVKFLKNENELNSSEQEAIAEIKRLIPKLNQQELEKLYEQQGDVEIKILEDLSRIASFLSEKSHPYLNIQGEKFDRLSKTSLNSFSLNILISKDGSMRWENLEGFLGEPFLKSTFISISGLVMPNLVKQFQEIVLNPEEDIVQDALRLIKPDLERVDVGEENKFSVRLSGVHRRLPLGNLGDGLRYLLGLTLALVKVPNGVLLVDDIDTGLHYSALTDMWKLVWETAKTLNVQVFATTHNSDCWQSLADIVEQSDLEAEDITIHRIEKGASRSVFYTAPKIVVAADRELEVR